MPDDSSSASTSMVAPRHKQSKTNATVGTVRGRTSPTHGEQNGDGRPPTKRARKAINCEPCRNSKLKCDRNRPCSSCVLRGTSALCYQDSRGHEGSDSLIRGDEPHRIDPAQEIARIRHSVSLLENHILPNQRNFHTHHTRRANETSNVTPKKETMDSDVDKNISPGMLGSHSQGGLYAGPTSAAINLASNEARTSEESEGRQDGQDPGEEFSVPDYDRDLLERLPSLDIIDGLVEFYFDYCNWIYRHVNQAAFTHNWGRFKNGSSSDRVVLATVCIIMAVAVHYLPTDHSLLDSFPETHEELSSRFHDVSRTSLKRRQAETRTYTLELVELLLIRTHYLTLAKRDTEEIWSVKGELVTIGTAMGLHRDPGKFKISKDRDLAERRRWAWWHIVLLERWQAFMFGRPLCIASHHFDTQLPSYCDPAIDKTGRLYLPNIALFRLAYILSDIMDDAVSVRPVSYNSVQANDRALTQWMEALPSELDLDEYRVARSLASPDCNVRRAGVQSVIIRTAYYHIRFTLHRPYATVATSPNPALNTSKAATVEAQKASQSLEIAVSAADKLITMVVQSSPDFLANAALAVPGHSHWGHLHAFSAAIFFAFQLIANPDQPGAQLFRSNIRKAIALLDQGRGTGVSLADKGYGILQALAPLYAVDVSQDSEELRGRKKAEVLSTVKKLAFPYHDSHSSQGSLDSPSIRGSMTPGAKSSPVSPPMGRVGVLSTPQQYEIMSQPRDRSGLPSVHQSPTLQPPTLNPYPDLSTHMSSLTDSPHSQSSPIAVNLYPASQSFSIPQQQVFGDNTRYAPYVHPVDEATMWGASIGFGQGEWAQFLHVMQRPEVSTPRHQGV